MLYGDNGILNKAKYASQEYSNATEEEKEKLAKTDNEIDEIIQGIRGDQNFQKNFTILDTKREEYNIPQDVTLAYIFISRGTTNIPYDISINSSIITSSEHISSTCRTDVNMAVYIDIYKVNLSGEAGKITLTKSGGSAASQAWNACIIF